MIEGRMPDHARGPPGIELGRLPARGRGARRDHQLRHRAGSDAPAERADGRAGTLEVRAGSPQATSRTAPERLLDPNNDAVTLNTSQKAAKAVGRELRLELVSLLPIARSGETRAVAHGEQTRSCQFARRPCCIEIACYPDRDRPRWRRVRGVGILAGAHEMVSDYAVPRSSARYGAAHGPLA